MLAGILEKNKTEKEVEEKSEIDQRAGAHRVDIPDKNLRQVQSEHTNSKIGHLETNTSDKDTNDRGVFENASPVHEVPEDVLKKILEVGKE